MARWVAGARHHLQAPAAAVAPESQPRRGHSPFQTLPARPGTTHPHAPQCRGRRHRDRRSPLAPARRRAPEPARRRHPAARRRHVGLPAVRACRHRRLRPRPAQPALRHRHPLPAPHGQAVAAPQGSHRGRPLHALGHGLQTRPRRPLHPRGHRTGQRRLPDPFRPHRIPRHRRRRHDLHGVPRTLPQKGHRRAGPTSTSTTASRTSRTATRNNSTPSMSRNPT